MVLKSGRHHLTSVAIHGNRHSAAIRPSGLRITGDRWPSAFVAFIFGLHPLHVESVAWIAERKDVLSGLFYILALWAYVLYVARPSILRYVGTLILFAFGIMAKPMIVTLPLVLLLLDMWPLRRVGSYREKLPFFALSGVAAIITYLAQQGSGAVKALDAIPLGLRMQNALVSYAVYILKVLWPTGLAVFYPYPPRWPAWQVSVATLLIAALSALVLRQRRERPYLAVGWLWYLVTLVPVIGLVQVGAQARADRYMYVPMVGLSICWLGSRRTWCNDGRERSWR